MPQQEFSPTRTHATWKPRVFDNDLAIYECPTCHQVHIGVTDGSDVTWTGTGRSLVAELPYGRSEAPFCDRCGTRMEPMPLIDVADLPLEFTLDFQFRGGFNSNCVKIKWFSKNRDLRPQWIAVKTFTGYQVKYVPEKKFSPVTFAFADEDAYCYCDSDPCEECMFRCKFGMCAYVYVKGIGLVRMSFDRMLASGSGSGNDGLRRTHTGYVDK